MLSTVVIWPERVHHGHRRGIRYGVVLMLGTGRDIRDTKQPERTSNKADKGAPAVELRRLIPSVLFPGFYGFAPASVSRPSDDSFRESAFILLSLAFCKTGDLISFADGCAQHDAFYWLALAPPSLCIR